MEASKEADLEVRTMHVFISRALSKIYREAPKKHTQLRNACNEVIGAPSAQLSPLPAARLPERARARGAGELKKNGAESFPVPDMDAATPPLTPATPADAAARRCKTFAPARGDPLRKRS
eukprot:1156095-Prymnesium_polylepis.1